MELLIAFALFFGLPLIFVGWTVYLMAVERIRGEPEQPMGDAIETPTVLHQTRRANHAKPR